MGMTLWPRHMNPEAWPVCYEHGWTIDEIATYFNSTPYMVTRKLDRAGIAMRGGSKVLTLPKAPRLTKEMRARAHEMRERMRK
jgi:hypothetical protein